MKYIAAAIAALALSAPAQAALQVYEFTASVSGLGDVRALKWAQSVGGSQEGSVISLNDRIVGRFNFDNTAKSSGNSASWFPGINTTSTSYYYNALTSPTNFFTFTILPSGQTVRVGEANTPTSSMTFTDGKPAVPDVTDTLSLHTQDRNGDVSTLEFYGSTANWVTNGGLPDQLSMLDMANAYLRYDYYKADGGRILLNATITSLNQVAVASVPEPGTWAMLLAGLTILGVSARRKRA